MPSLQWSHVTMDRADCPWFSTERRSVRGKLAEVCAAPLLCAPRTSRSATKGADVARDHFSLSRINYIYASQVRGQITTCFSCALALHQQTALRLADLRCMKTKQCDLYWHKLHMAMQPYVHVPQVFSQGESRPCHLRRL